MLARLRKMANALRLLLRLKPMAWVVWHGRDPGSSPSPGCRRRLSLERQRSLLSQCTSFASARSTPSARGLRSPDVDERAQSFIENFRRRLLQEELPVRHCGGGGGGGSPCMAPVSPWSYFRRVKADASDAGFIIPSPIAPPCSRRSSSIKYPITGTLMKGKPKVSIPKREALLRIQRFR